MAVAKAEIQHGRGFAGLQLELPAPQIDYKPPSGGFFVFASSHYLFATNSLLVPY